MPGDLAIPRERDGSGVMGQPCRGIWQSPGSVGAAMPWDLAIPREREGEPCRGIWQSPGSVRDSQAGGFGNPPGA
ncbi:hypothetical protein QUF72_02160 [Desulfobacterales bacterium HSG2]|nr:hypothetical protein [Desulfobacterales bacterium HSG2]